MRDEYFSSASQEDKIRTKGRLEHEHLSGPAFNYNEGKKKSLVMASLECTIIALLSRAERLRGEGEGDNERDMTAIYSLKGKNIHHQVSIK